MSGMTSGDAAGGAASATPGGPGRATVRVGHALVDRLGHEEAVDRICRLAVGPAWAQIVVTPNLHHVVELERTQAFRDAYRDAALVLADGWPVVAAARLFGAAGQQRVTGADLLPAVCGEAARRGLSVAFVGGQPGAAEACASRLRARFPSLRVAFVHPAPVGFDVSVEARTELLDGLADRHPDVLFLGLGAPRQELFAHRYRPKAHVVLCVGAALDFSAGLRPRAPQLVRRLGLEWLFRILVEPRRLWRRYASAAVPFLRVVWRQWRGGGGGGSGTGVAA